MHPQSEWERGVKEPFDGGRDRFAAIPKAERSNHIKKILQVQQMSTPPPFEHMMPFPAEGELNGLHYYSLQRSASPRAILVFIHGVNSNGSTFGYMANKIAEPNPEVNIYAYDQTNFGKTGGNSLGFINSLQDSADEALKFIQALLDKFQHKPKVFLCGHSFGGAITIKVSLLAPGLCSGLLLLAPLLKDIDESYYYAKRVMKFVGWIFPSFRIKGSPPPGLGTKYNLSKKFTEDPLIFTEAVVPATIRAAMNAANQIYASLGKITTPFLCIAPAVEKLVDPFAALDLEERSPAEDKRVVYCEEMWHVITEEEEVDGVAWHCAEWLRERA